MRMKTFHAACYDFMRIGGDRPLEYGPKKDTLKSLSDSINFVDIWLQSFEENHVWHCNAYLLKTNNLQEYSFNHA